MNQACSDGNEGKVKELLEHRSQTGLDINGSVEDGETPRQPYQVPVKTYVKVVKQINIQSF